MASRSYKQDLAAIRAQAIAPVLIGAGFVERARVFLRADVGIVALIRVEVSPFATPHALAFHLVLQLFAGALTREEAVSEHEVSRRAYPFYSQPIGSLWGEPGASYTLTEEVSDTALGARVQGDLESHVLPFCARFVTTDDALTYLIDQNRQTGSTLHSLVIATILARAGKLADSRRYFLESPLPRDTVRKIAAAYGVTLDDS